MANPSSEGRHIIDMLKIARDERMKSHECKQGLDWITANISRVK
jgi:hypothetical protein